MKARLITACGCEREIDIKLVGGRIHVPILRNVYSFRAEDTLPKPVIPERIFDCYGHDSDDPETLIYRERVE
jgi:hypothetical protein